MLSFFRKIRFKSLSDGSLGKYFRYAVGEIILVVIGILIALQINNWNEQRKQNLKSDKYLIRIQQDLKRLVKLSEGMVRHNKKILSDISRTMELLEAGNLESPEDINIVENAFLWMSRTTYQIPELTTYDEMKANGDLELISDIELRNKISSFRNYLSEVEDVYAKLGDSIEREYIIFNKHLRSYVNPVTMDITYQYDFEEMSEDIEFVNTFSRVATHWRGFVFFIDQVNKIGSNISQRVDAKIQQRLDSH